MELDDIKISEDHTDNPIERIQENKISHIFIQSNKYYWL